MPNIVIGTPGGVYFCIIIKKMIRVSKKDEIL